MVAREALERALIALWCVAAAGCAKVAEDAAKDLGTATEVVAEPVLAEISTTLPVAAVTETADATRSASRASLSDGKQDAIADPSAGNEVAILPQSVPTPDLPPVAVKQPVSDPAAFATREREGRADLVASLPVSPPGADTLDVTSLLTRLRKTKAINLRTKLAVKNESDELLERVRAYHEQQGTATLVELRQSYDSLIRKLYSLLEDNDPSLAREVDRSRAAIWARLADPVQFGLSTRRLPPA